MPRQVLKAVTDKVYTPEERMLSTLKWQGF